MTKPPLSYKNFLWAIFLILGLIHTNINAMNRALLSPCSEENLPENTGNLSAINLDALNESSISSLSALLGDLLNIPLLATVKAPQNTSPTIFEIYASSVFPGYDNRFQLEIDLSRLMLMLSNERNLVVETIGKNYAASQVPTAALFAETNHCTARRFLATVFNYALMSLSNALESTTLSSQALAFVSPIFKILLNTTFKIYAYVVVDKADGTSEILLAEFKLTLLELLEILSSEKLINIIYLTPADDSSGGNTEGAVSVIGGGGDIILEDPLGFFAGNL